MVSATIRILGGVGTMLNRAIWFWVKGTLKLLRGMSRWLLYLLRLILIHLSSSSSLYQISMLFAGAMAVRG